VTAALVPHTRSEPLLWLQLIAFGAIPLEALLLLLLLAGADPGPVPALERLLVWGLGVLAPTLLLWRRPADCCSLLLVQVPLQARSELQRRLAGLQASLVPRLLLLGGAAVLLPAFWWLDRVAALAGNSSLLESGNRLVALLLAVPLLALLLWQWHQLSQSGSAWASPCCCSIPWRWQLGWSSLRRRLRQPQSLPARLRSNQSRLPKPSRAAIWINRSPEASSLPAALRMAMVASPIAPEAVRASQRARRSPRQGVRTSCSRR
jgi:hypothetical protein